jgi:hypothetical protein
VSSNATFDISEDCANVGVVIRRGILPILCIAAKIKCKNSEDGQSFRHRFRSEKGS